MAFYLFFLCSAIAWAADQAPSSAATCVTCHGPKGEGVSPFPSLAGQHAQYLQKTLMDYQKGENGPRNHPVMVNIAKGLSVEEIAQLAQYYSELPLARNEAQTHDQKLSAQLYYVGDAARRLPACSACHGPTGAGLGSAFYPRLSHQQAQYIAEQLRQYQTGERKHPMMSLIAGPLNTEEIQALSEFIAGLEAA